MSVTSWNPPDVDNEDVIGTVANLKVHMFERDCRSFIIAHGIQRFRLLDGRYELFLKLNVFSHLNQSP
jgi:hypothetical protein